MIPWRIHTFWYWGNRNSQINRKRVKLEKDGAHVSIKAKHIAKTNFSKNRYWVKEGTHWLGVILYVMLDMWYWIFNVWNDKYLNSGSNKPFIKINYIEFPCGTTISPIWLNRWNACGVGAVILIQWPDCRVGKRVSGAFGLHDCWFVDKCCFRVHYSKKGSLARAI